MDEYIKRQDALTELYAIGFYDDKPIQTRNRVLKIIRNITAADVAFVVHGKWINDQRVGFGSVESMCSNCERRMIRKSYSNYCPNCGAKMDL